MSEQGTTKDQVSEAAEIANSFIQYAYDQGMHEVGIDPVRVLTDEITKLRRALKRAASQCGHVYNCSAARGSERDCTCGWAEVKELARNLP